MRKQFATVLVWAAVSAPAGRAEGLASLHARLFERYLAGMVQRPTGDYRSNIYPTEPAIFFLAGWMITDSHACLAAARKQLALAERPAGSGGIPFVLGGQLRLRRILGPYQRAVA